MSASAASTAFRYIFQKYKRSQYHMTANGLRVLSDMRRGKGIPGAFSIVIFQP